MKMRLSYRQKTIKKVTAGTVTFLFCLQALTNILDRTVYNPF